MNIIAIKLVLVERKTGSTVMYEILTIVATFFECTCINSTFLGRNSLPLILIHFLNQACAGHRSARAWFFEIVSVQTSVCVRVCVCVCVCVFVYVSAPEAINN